MANAHCLLQFPVVWIILVCLIPSQLKDISDVCKWGLFRIKLMSSYLHRFWKLKITSHFPEWTDAWANRSWWHASYMPVRRLAPQTAFWSATIQRQQGYMSVPKIPHPHKHLRCFRVSAEPFWKVQRAISLWFNTDLQHSSDGDVKSLNDVVLVEMGWENSVKAHTDPT